jgi:hypothetical protein
MNSGSSSKSADKLSATAPARIKRIKRAHQAATYDDSFREQVQASIDDLRLSLDDEQVHRRFAAKRAALARPAALRVR